MKHPFSSLGLGISILLMLSTQVLAFNTTNQNCTIIIIGNSSPSQNTEVLNFQIMENSIQNTLKIVEYEQTSLNNSLIALQQYFMGFTLIITVLIAAIGFLGYRGMDSLIKRNIEEITMDKFGELKRLNENTLERPLNNLESRVNELYLIKQNPALQKAFLKAVEEEGRSSDEKTKNGNAFD